MGYDQAWNNISKDLTCGKTSMIDDWFRQNEEVHDEISNLLTNMSSIRDSASVLQQGSEKQEEGFLTTYLIIVVSVAFIPTFGLFVTLASPAIVFFAQNCCLPISSCMVPGCKLASFYLLYIILLVS
jgi:hypothetical protein